MMNPSSFGLFLGGGMRIANVIASHPEIERVNMIYNPEMSEILLRLVMEDEPNEALVQKLVNLSYHFEFTFSLWGHRALGFGKKCARLSCGSRQDC